MRLILLLTVLTITAYSAEPTGQLPINEIMAGNDGAFVGHGCVAHGTERRGATTVALA
jgi:hypothetical protein